MNDYGYLLTLKWNCKFIKERISNNIQSKLYGLMAVLIKLHFIQTNKSYQRNHALFCSLSEFEKK